jgi:galactonate dehydratase
VKITSIETFLVHPGRRNYVFVKVHTDEGLYGVGEAYSAGPDDATAAVIADFESWLLGRDPLDIEFLWQLMYNATRFPGGVVTNAAISGIEHALWDIKGKAVGAPVYQLLGGKCRDKIRVYQNPGGGTPEEMAERATALIERYGYTALKIGPLPPGSERMPWNQALRESAKRLETLRKAVGEDVDIGVDPHAKIFEPVRAMQLAQALKPYNPYFIEEPLRPENIDAMGELKAQYTQLGVPLATGEMLYTKFEFRDLLVRSAADIIQPDICCAGGLLEQKKIAAMAEAFYVTVAPHNPMGPVATAVNVHFAACTPNFLILEYHPDDEGPRRELVDEPMKLVDGYLELPTRPGLGIDLNVDAYEKYPFKRWTRAFPIRADGSMGHP